MISKVTHDNSQDVHFNPDRWKGNVHKNLKKRMKIKRQISEA